MKIEFKTLRIFLNYITLLKYDDGTLMFRKPDFFKTQSQVQYF